MKNMNILEVIADVLKNPEEAYSRMLAAGLNPAVIDEVLALDRDKSAMLVSAVRMDLSQVEGGGAGDRVLTFIVKDNS